MVPVSTVRDARLEGVYSLELASLRLALPCWQVLPSPSSARSFRDSWRSARTPSRKYTSQFSERRASHEPVRAKKGEHYRSQSAFRIPSMLGMTGRREEGRHVAERGDMSEPSKGVKIPPPVDRQSRGKDPLR